MSANRPNILVVMADQLTASVLPFYGGPVDAPAMEELATEGVVFDNAYCSTPLCAPSRASLLAGRLPSAIGTYDNAAELHADVPTIAHHLRASGYATCLAGKMHFIGPDQLHGFEERLTTDVYTAGFDWIPDWSLPLRERLPWYHDLGSVLEAGVSEATLQLDYDEEVAFHSVRRIYDFGRERDRPFFFLVSFTHPHDPYEIPARYWERYDDRGVEPPTVGPLPPAEQDPHSLRLLEMCGADDVELTPELVATARRAYYGAVSYVDDKVAELLRALEAVGLRESTIVVLASDHGDMLGERGLWYKMSFFEDSVRVPLVVHAPERFAPARIRDAVSLLDLLPSFVDLADAEPPGDCDGCSFVPLLRGESAPPRTVAAEYLAEGTFAPMLMLREGSLKYVHCPDDPDLLYDLEADPLELRNLAGEPSYEETVRGLRARVVAGWDLERIGHDVAGSQRRRLFVSAALARGTVTTWDYAPPDTSTGRYVRGRDFWRPFGRARLRLERDAR